MNIYDLFAVPLCKFTRKEVITIYTDFISKAKGVMSSIGLKRGKKYTYEELGNLTGYAETTIRAFMGGFANSRLVALAISKELGIKMID